MNNTAFFTHRADQRMLALQRAFLANEPITPARYFLLLFVKKLGAAIGHHGRFMHQSDIWKTLGVRPATTSKMLKQMETLKLVRRERCLWDRREVLVFLTRKARGILYRVDRNIIQPGLLWIATQTILGGPTSVGRLEYLLERMRRELFDYATFWFPHCKRTLYPERRFKTPPPFVWPGTEDAPIENDIEKQAA